MPKWLSIRRILFGYDLGHGFTMVDPLWDAVMRDQITHIQDHLPELLRAADAIQFSDGQVLFYAGHVPTGIFVIEAGEVILGEKVSSSSEENALSTRDGVLLGAHQVLRELPYAQSCAAVGVVQVKFIPKHAVMRLFHNHV